MRESVRWFAARMEEALARHDGRPGWRGESFRFLLLRLRGELEELRDCFAAPAVGGDDEYPPAVDPEQIIGEAVDVANFALMIADNARRQQPAPEEARDGYRNGA